MEHKDEYPDIWIYGKGITIDGNGTVSPTQDRGNSELYNGRLNTMREWELVGANNTTFSSKSWETYMDVE